MHQTLGSSHPGLHKVCTRTAHCVVHYDNIQNMRSCNTDMMISPDYEAHSDIQYVEHIPYYSAHVGTFYSCVSLHVRYQSV